MAVAAFSATDRVFFSVNYQAGIIIDINAIILEASNCLAKYGVAVIGFVQYRSPVCIIRPAFSRSERIFDVQVPTGAEIEFLFLAIVADEDIFIIDQPCSIFFPNTDAHCVVRADGSVVVLIDGKLHAPRLRRGLITAPGRYGGGRIFVRQILQADFHTAIFRQYKTGWEMEGEGESFLWVHVRIHTLIKD
ncbi:hypothetical protein D3C81_1520240 [compost metagenome]